MNIDYYKVKIQMSEIQSESRRQKTKEDYSRNVKKLKVKLANVQNEILTLQKKVDSLTNVSNDKLISMKIVKFCKERRFTPQMLFRFADKKCTKSVSKIDFRQTLSMLGLKLSKDQFLRLQYLIDEDLSGQISYEEYNGYLDAFGIKKQFSPGDQIARQIMQKIDLSKVLQIVEENNQSNENKDKPKKHANLLNYEEFIKYCHKHFPGLKNKELASIFNRLQKNQMINLQDLIDFLQNQQAQKKRLQEKNKKKNTLKIRRQDSFIKNFNNNEKSLKNIIQGLFRYRNKDNTILFHSIQFSQLQRLLNTKRGEILSLFQQIDRKKKGSFTHDQLINYLIIKFKGTQDLLYIFEIMGHKYKVLKQSPQASIGQYSSKPDFLTEQELKKFLQGQFDVKWQESKIIIQKIPREQDGFYSIQSIIELMRCRDGKRPTIIKPNMPVSKLMFKSARNALKCCLQIEQKLIQKKQLKWDDYEFGPTQGDQFGVQSVNLNLPSQKIDWFRCEQIGMIEFFKQNLDTTYSCSSVCPDQTLAKTLFWLVSLNSQILWSKEKPDSGIKSIEQQHLQHIFRGIHPLAFHPFQKYGIYVIKLFLQQKWKYVIIDSKIPCSAEKNPFFSCVANKRYSFISLIEKAYAKALGSYQHIYEIINYNKFIFQIANILPVQYKFEDVMSTSQKDIIWSGIMKNQDNLQKMKKENRNKQKLNYIYAIKRSKNDKIANFEVHKPIKIEQVVQLLDNKCKNYHKSHRLLILRAEQSFKQEESSWNKNWNRQDGKNKYSQMNLQLADKMTEPSILKSKNIILLNYKLFRRIFCLFRYESVNFAQMIVLRKQIQFEKNECRYEITAKSELQVVVVLRQSLLASENKVMFHIQNENKQKICQQIHPQKMVIMPIKIEQGKTRILQLSIVGWQPNIEYNYSLTFYMKHGRYQLKQRDRHLLFRFVSPYEEEPKLSFSDFQEQEKQYIYRNFYKGAERRGCCG